MQPEQREQQGREAGPLQVPPDRVPVVERVRLPGPVLEWPAHLCRRRLAQPPEQVAPPLPEQGPERRHLVLPPEKQEERQRQVQQGERRDHPRDQDQNVSALAEG